MNKILHSVKDVRKLLREYKPTGICVVTSESLRKRLNWAVKEIGAKRSDIAIIPDGEKAKEWEELAKLLKKFSELKLDRSSIVIALGGGAVGDVVGFAASIYLRGIKHIQIPTTLLAQVDSAYGGKNGINFAGFKNQIGTTHLPLAIVTDLRFIRALPEELLISGLGEVIKSGLIKDTAILKLLEKETLKSLPKSRNLGEIVERAIRVKDYHVKGDLDDRGVRQLLNLGHTVGHALELKYGISHGRAVIIGTLQEMQIAVSLGLTSSKSLEYLCNLLQRLNISVKMDLKPDWEMILHDKKIRGDSIVFPIVDKIGDAKLTLLKLNKLKRSLNC